MFKQSCKSSVNGARQLAIQFNVLTGKSIASPEILSFVEGRSSLRTGGVQWTNPLEHPDWDGQISGQNHTACSFFHSAAWAGVLAETYGYTPIYFVANQSGVMRSLLPMMEVQSVLTGNRAVGLPFTDSCDPLCADKAGFKELFRNAMELARVRGWKYLEFRGGQDFFDEIPPSVSFYGHRVDVSANENDFFGQLKSAVRRAIRKAEKSGVCVEISGELPAVKDFYLLHSKARKRHGLPPQPFSFFKNIHKHILAKNLGMVVLARWNGIPIAGAVFFYGAGAAIYKFGASDDSRQDLRGNNLVFWEAIRWFSRRGVRKLDLGRTSIGNEGLRRFKLGWNATEKNISYYRFSIEQKKFVSKGDESSGWYNRAFNAMPLFASRMVGEVLYRHWA